MKITQLADGFQQDQDVVHQKPQRAPSSRLQRSTRPAYENQLGNPTAPLVPKNKRSLYHDMVTGWKPHFQLPSPIPLFFQDDITQNLQDLKGYRLVYLGPLPSTSYFLHSNKDYQFPYRHLKRKPQPARKPFQGQSTEFKNVVFDGDFQGGNLQAVVQFSKNQFDLFMRVDTNTRGHRQWFNFKVSSQTQNKIRFNIWGLKGRCLYQNGMRPYGLSSLRGKWGQIGSNIEFSQCSLKSRYKGNSRLFENLNRLSFEYDLTGNETLQLAYCIPYTYTRLRSFIQASEVHPYFHSHKMCLSLSGLQVPIFTITQPSHHKKKCILINARTHPGQSNGSFLMEGLIRFLLSQELAAQWLRSRVDFRIVPMLNPDGVVSGNYRTGMSGTDLNRIFQEPEQQIFPEVFNLKQTVFRLKSEYGKEFFMFMDLHGHSVKKNVFMYGPQFSISEKQYYQCKIFPKLLADRTSMFRFFSCVFRLAECKQSTARGVLMKKLKVPFCYTVEASNYAFYDQSEKKDYQFDQQCFLKMGGLLMQSLEEYLSMLVKQQQSLRSRIVNRHKKRRNQASPLLKVVQEIKRIQKQHKVQKNYGDQQEGQSDCQSDENDLQPQKIKLLFSAIKQRDQLPFKQPPKKKFVYLDRLKVNEQQKFPSQIIQPSNQKAHKDQKDEDSKVIMLGSKPVISPLNFNFQDPLKDDENTVFANTVFVRQNLPRRNIMQGDNFFRPYRKFLSPSPVRRRQAIRTSSFVIGQR